jgi:hypothetical protein
MVTKDFAENILQGAGLDKKEIKQVFKNSEELTVRFV